VPHRRGRVPGQAGRRAGHARGFREVAYIIQTNDFLAEMLAHKPRLANGQEMITFKNGGRYDNRGCNARWFAW
jgi:hypothetical protein